MNTPGFMKYAAAPIALAICSACAGGAGVAPSSAALDIRYAGKTLSVNGRLVTAARANLTAPAYAMMLPDKKSNAKTYEYVINDYTTYATIFDYPKSTKQIGTIENVGGQGCTNVLYGYGKLTFWIVAADNQIEEFLVPKKPVTTLSDNVGAPSSCGMNTSGDLAVGILDGSGGGDVLVYKNAKGNGKVYTTGLAREYFDGYDPQGNLFADGFNRSYSFELDELPKGGSSFRQITLSNQVQFPGSVQWDGKYLTVFDQEANAVYQYTIKGTKGTLKGTVRLSGSGDCAQTWNAGNLLYCGDAGNNDGEVFKYPKGGSPIATFSGAFDLPLGVVAAQK